LTERCRTDDPVNDNSAVLLERADRGIDLLAEVRRIVTVRADTEKPEPFETVSDLGYCWISDSPREM